MEDAEFKPSEEVIIEGVWERLHERIRLLIMRRLSEARREQGMSQEDLAKRIRTTQSRISQTLGGKDGRSPTLATLVKLAWGVKKEIKIDFVDRFSDLEPQSIPGAQTTTWISPPRPTRVCWKTSFSSRGTRTTGLDTDILIA